MDSRLVEELLVALVLWALAQVLVWLFLLLVVDFRLLFGSQGMVYIPECEARSNE
jgi:hypothetical protein